MCKVLCNQRWHVYGYTSPSIYEYCEHCKIMHVCIHTDMAAMEDMRSPRSGYHGKPAPHFEMHIHTSEYETAGRNLFHRPTPTYFCGNNA